MVVGSTVQSSIGMGQGLVTTPILRLLHPDLLPGPVVIAGLAVSVGLVIRNSEVGDVRPLLPAFAGRLVGLAIAVWLLATLDERNLSLFIAGLVLAFVVMRLAGVNLALTPATLGGAGVVSGVGGAIAGLGGAPMALVLEQHSAARNFRGPMGLLLAVGGAISTLVLVVAGVIDGEAALLGLSLLPPIAVGWVLARWTTPIVDRGYLRPLVLGLSAASAVVLLASEML